MMSHNNMYLKKNLNNSQSHNKNEENYRMYKTKTEFFPPNSSYNQYNKTYMKFEPENLKQKYKPILYKNKTILSNITNNNLNNSINNKIFKKSFFLNNSKNNSFLNSKSNDKSFGQNNIDKNKVDLNKEKSKGLSPIKNDNGNNNIYISKGVKNSKNKNVQNVPYNNHTYEYKIVNNDYIINNTQKLNNNNSKINQRLKNNNMPSLNIYQIKMTNIFVQIINKNIFKHIKKDMILFFDNLKNYCYNFYHNRRILNDYSDYKYKKKESKYNQYKDIIYNYFKTNNNFPGIIYKNLYENEKLINSLKKKKLSNAQNNDSKKKNSNNNKNDKNDKTVQIKLRELQKKYENIYKRKKNYSISFDERFNKYLEKNETHLYEPKKAYYNNKLKDSSSKNEVNNERTMFKRKILINQLNKNRTKFHKTNLSQEINPSSNFKNQIIYNSYSNTPKNSIIFNLNREESRNNKNRIIIKKIKTKLSGNFKRKSSNSIGKQNENKISREIFKVKNIKNIVTSDKRLYVHINYISLYNDKKNYNKNKNNYYKHNLLKISDKINIIFNKRRLILKSNKKHETLSKIIEENSVKNNNSSNENDNEDNNDISNEKEKSEENTHILQNDVVINIVLDFNKDIEINSNIDDNSNNNLEINKLKIYAKENERYLNSNDKDEDNKRNDSFENINNK